MFLFIWLTGLLGRGIYFYLMTTARLPVMLVFTWPPAGPAFNYLMTTAQLPVMFVFTWPPAGRCI